MNLLSRLSAAVLPLFLLIVLSYGQWRKVKLYDAFVNGARDGLMTALRLTPYLIAIFAAVGLFRDSGAMNLLAAVLRPLLGPLGIPADIIPLALVRPLSGSAGLAMLAETVKRHGPDSPVGFLAAVIQGSTETTFYVLTVYFGAVAVRETRHTLTAGLSGDICAFVTAAIVARLFM